MAAERADLFPDSPRVFYEKAPLVEVISQLRYPPILAIQGRPPVDFQERVRGAFPLMEEGDGIGLPPGMEMPAEIRQAFGIHSVSTVYRFLTEDRLDTIVLARDSLSYTTKKYTLWENFMRAFADPLMALAVIYKPSFYTRIGLRYVDAINREALGLGDANWSELFRHEILGEVAIPIVESNLEAANRQIRIKIPGGPGSVLLQHGLANITEKPGLSYMIDFDFYRSEKTEVHGAEHVLNQFHDLAGRAFRWCITERLHNALQPKPIGDVNNAESSARASPD